MAVALSKLGTPLRSNLFSAKSATRRPLLVLPATFAAGQRRPLATVQIGVLCPQRNVKLSLTQVSQ